MGVLASRKAKGRQLVNFDGSDYETRFLPKKTRLVRQLISAPAVQWGVATNFAVAALEICKMSDGSVTQATAIVAASMATLTGAALINRLYFRHINDGPALDKSGHAGAGQVENYRAAGHFVLLSTIQAIAGVAMGGMGKSSPAMVPVAMAALASTLPQAMWHFKAAANLTFGRWTVNGAPPRSPGRPDKKLGAEALSSPAR